jgi:cellulose synthase/poly-beta-1,6-N-acetylglucosamine synthase-like glycosyltransferase
MAESRRSQSVIARSEELPGEYGKAHDAAVVAGASTSNSTPHRVVVLIPAHNESEGITETVTALSRQTRRPDEILVVSDNSTDNTVDLAKRAGAYVTETVENSYKKAGALNQALSTVLPRLQEDDFVLVQDADSVLDPEFIESALSHLTADDQLGAVGGVFRGQDGGGFVGHLQRNEYARYARDVRRLKGRCLVVTGTAAVFRASTLQHVRSARLSREIPIGDGHGGIYDTTVLTEDNEISFALMHLGYKILSPKGCTLTTEVMPTWRELWNQRLRWKRGAIENCVQYGLTRVTAPYWARQLVTMLGVLVTAAYLVTIVWSLMAYGLLDIEPFWLALTGVFAVERIITLRDRGLVRQMIAGSLYELPFDIFLQVCHGKAYLDSVMNRERRW